MYDIILSFITALTVTYFLIPSIIHVAKVKNLVDVPGERRSHDVITPSLGGIAIFGGVMISIVLWTPFNLFGDLQYILAAFTIIFLIGAKDDILPMSPSRKFLGELFAVVILVTKSNIRLSSFQGLFGIYEIPYWFSVLISLVTVLMIVNAFNLIDGINGLTAFLGILICVFMTGWFFLVDELALSLISFSTAGACFAFLYYNMTPAKIFMGDTGSLFIGMICAILAISFIEINLQIEGESRYAIGAAPAVAIAVVSVPVLDTLRVFFLRIIRGRSPFKPDRHHIHHLALDSGFTHMESSIGLTLFNGLMIYLAITFQDIGVNTIFFLLVFIFVIFTSLLFFASRRKVRRGETA